MFISSQHRLSSLLGKGQRVQEAMAVKNLSPEETHISTNYLSTIINRMTPHNFKVIGNVVFSIPGHHGELDKSTKRLYYTSSFLNVFGVPVNTRLFPGHF